MILVPTQFGGTVRHIARFRPKQPIIAFTSSQTIMRRLSLFRGITPRLIDEPKDTDAITQILVQHSLDTGDMSAEDLAVITAGHPVWGALFRSVIERGSPASINQAAIAAAHLFARQ